ncbi:phosphotransferase family protein [Actinomyces minihominis]|uniref:phosphotransferase family protein n=1 Tax=Actinomyces minihominis TaxID=2002838 RepID=UPI000C078398|nr:phosphotransferase [Actinomyces minihominis]
MESITKNRQTPEVLRALIARAYGPEQVPLADDFATEMTEGWFNVLYRITLRNGAQVVLKIAPPADIPVLTREVQMMRAELEAMRLVSTLTDVPVPRVYYADLSHDIVDADLFFMEYIDADNFGFSIDAGLIPEDVEAEAMRELGELNAQINTVTGPNFGPLLGEGSPTWREAFTGMVEETLVDGEKVGIDLGWPHEQFRHVLEENAAALDEVTVPQLIEVDLWAKNSLIRDGKIVAVLDHERAIYGDPLMEAELLGIDVPAIKDPSAFMEGFGISELTQNQRVRRRLYTLYLALIMTVETKYRGHTDTVIYDQGRGLIDDLMAQFGQTRN